MLYCMKIATLMKGSCVAQKLRYLLLWCDHKIKHWTLLRSSLRCWYHITCFSKLWSQSWKGTIVWNILYAVVLTLQWKHHSLGCPHSFGYSACGFLSLLPVVTLTLYFSQYCLNQPQTPSGTQETIVFTTYLHIAAIIGERTIYLSFRTDDEMFIQLQNKYIHL